MDSNNILLCANFSYAWLLTSFNASEISDFTVGGAYNPTKFKVRNVPNEMRVSEKDFVDFREEIGRVRSKQDLLTLMGKFPKRKELSDLRGLLDCTFKHNPEEFEQLLVYAVRDTDKGMLVSPELKVYTPDSVVSKCLMPTPFQNLKYGTTIDINDLK